MHTAHHPFAILNGPTKHHFYYDCYCYKRDLMIQSNGVEEKIFELQKIAKHLRFIAYAVAGVINWTLVVDGDDDSSKWFTWAFFWNNSPEFTLCSIIYLPFKPVRLKLCSLNDSHSLNSQQLLLFHPPALWCARAFGENDMSAHDEYIRRWRYGSSSARHSSVRLQS